MRVTEAAQHNGLTYRQLDYWLRCQLIHAPSYGSGRGNDRVIPASELPVLAVMARLARAGLTPAHAAHLARQMTAANTSSIRLDGGITLTLEAHP